VTHLKKSEYGYHSSTVIPATADFEYSKDWLVTDLHRLSYYHVHGTCSHIYTHIYGKNQQQLELVAILL